jgi:hypothetical protein
MPQPPPAAKLRARDRLEAALIGFGTGDAREAIKFGQGIENKPIADWNAANEREAASAKTALDTRNTESEIALRGSQAANQDSEAAARANPQPKEPTNDFELWARQNPQAPAGDWLKLQESVKPAPSDTTKLSPDVEAQIGPQPNRKSFQPGPEGDKVFAAQNKSWGVAAEKIINEKAAAAGQSRGAAYGRNRPVQVLDTFNGNRPVTVSAGDAEDNPQRYVTQSGGEKALPKEALIGDIRTSAQNVKKNLDVLNAKGFDRATLAAALANPDSTAGAFIQALPRGALDDRAQQFVTDLFNLREQAMAMRSVLGMGAGSEDMRRAIIQTLPGVATPGDKFGAKQIDNLLAVLDRLEKGVPNVPMTDRSSKPAGGSKILKYDQQGNPIQ